MNQPAPATNMPKACERCGSNATRWIQQAPECPRPFRVECRLCQRFNKWANEGQLGEAKLRRLDIIVKPYQPPKARNTLDDFLVDPRDPAKKSDK